jgi:uncharacterized protein
MTNQQKTILFWLGAAFLVVACIYLLASTQQKVETAATTNTVSFSGEGKVSAKPDIAQAYVSIITEATTTKAAQDQNSAKSQKVVEYLKSKNIDEKDIKTSSYNIYPQYDYSCQYSNARPCDSVSKIKSYRVEQSMQVKIRNLDEAGNIIDGVVSAGANQVSSFNFTIENPEELQSQAREKAITAAKEKASNLKSQLGIRLGRIVNFVEGGNYYPMYEAKALDSSIAGRGGAVPSLPSGESEITVNVTITYQIK